MLASSVWHSMTCLLTWSVRVTPAGRSFFRLRASVPRTCEIGYSLWPTPVSSQADRPIRPLAPSERTSQHGVMLCAAIYDSQEKSPQRMWLTPTANDAKNATLPPGAGKRDSLPGELIRSGVSGSLNPLWVEWLMGFPPGWTDCDVSETR